ncbi:MAG: toll/interleukin-1 receptor domain-containing protein [Caldilineaceae bacterium]
MSEEFVYDVFLSYSHTDADWVRGALLTRLEQAGLKVCIDFRDFAAGAPLMTEMERAVLESQPPHAMLVLTPAYIGAWAEFENLMVQTIDPTSRQRRLIPLLKASVSCRCAFACSPTSTLPTPAALHTSGASC